MRQGTPPYRLLVVFAALTLVGMSAAPLVEHLCDRADEVAATHDCCGDHCPGHLPPLPRGDEPGGEAPASAETLCCVQLPADPLRAAPALKTVAGEDLAPPLVARGAPPAASPAVPPASLGSGSHQADRASSPLRVHARCAVWLI